MSQPCDADRSFAQRAAAVFAADDGGRRRSTSRQGRIDACDSADWWLAGGDWSQQLANEIAKETPRIRRRLHGAPSTKP